MKLVLLGAPGSGKGTQASLISKRYNLPAISTGDIFRENIKNQTALGIKVKTIMDSGNLCPDDLTIELVKDRLSQPDCANGYLLDGFPRNLVQAQALDVFSTPDKILDIDVDLNKIERRLIGRRSCPKCNGSFHIDFIGDTKVCPTCGAELIIRKDDNVETVKERLSVYQKQTAPLIEYYKNHNILFEINGDQKIEDVFSEITKVLDL